MSFLYSTRIHLAIIIEADTGYRLLAICLSMALIQNVFGVFTENILSLASGLLLNCVMLTILAHSLMWAITGGRHETAT